MISFVVIEFVLLEDLFITNLVIYQYIPFFLLFSIPKITPINGKNLFGLNSMAYNILSLARQDLSKHTGVKHRNKETAKRAKLLTSYNNVFSTFKGIPLLTLNYLFKFLETPPLES